MGLAAPLALVTLLAVGYSLRLRRDRDWYRETLRIAVRSRDKAERQRDAACAAATQAVWETSVLKRALVESQRWRRTAEGVRVN